jgi:hypothetical protein
MGDSVTIIEKLARLEHEQWCVWAHRLLATEPLLSSERQNRWRELMCDYDELPEEWKEYDRAWAIKVYDAVMKHKFEVEVGNV